MREIKFRTWDGEAIKMASAEMLESLYFRLKPRNPKATLMQYTGRKDKNGKEIYSGDILFNEVKNGVVQWSDKYMGWMSSDIHKMDGDGVYEVIGNIYENPDLLLSSEGDIM